MAISEVESPLSRVQSPWCPYNFVTRLLYVLYVLYVVISLVNGTFYYGYILFALLYR